MSMIKTKIVATLGPACLTGETMSAMIDNGVDLFRLNFSHGSLEGHGEVLDALNEVRARHMHTAGVMGDLCGPKIRTSKMTPDGEVVSAGDEVVIVRGDAVGTARRFGSNYENLLDDVEAGHRIFIDDGQLALRVREKRAHELVCDVVVGGPMKSRKGMNLPDTDVSIPSITERDWECVDWAIERKVDFLALSFVRSAEDVMSLRERLYAAESDIKIVAKIETPQALADLENIVRASDALLVARGDLGVEMDLAEVPLLQKRITTLCRRYGKPVVVATQMLQSMIDSPTATRAEVSDVANAIMDFTDAVMLSGETAVGKYPLEAVKTIRRIAKVTEAYLDEHTESRPKTETTEDLALTAAVARSVAQIVEDIDAKLVGVWSQTGSAARLLSKARIDVPILALSSDIRACQQMSLHYGVIPRCQPIPGGITEFTERVDKMILGRKWAMQGEKVVLVAGKPMGAAGTTNCIVVHTITAE